MVRLNPKEIRAYAPVYGNVSVGGFRTSVFFPSAQNERFPFSRYDPDAVCIRDLRLFLVAHPSETCLDYTSNPARIFGFGLAVNIFGVWCGGLIGQTIMKRSSGEYLLVAAFSISILFIVFLLLPLLNYHMSKLLQNHVFFKFFSALEPEKQNTIMNSLGISFSELTEREKEIVGLVLKGYTYTKISEMLFISENTIKTHTKNIYRKLNISSKNELIELYANENSIDEK